MRRAKALTALMLAVAAVAALATGASGQIGPQAIVCTGFYPANSNCFGPGYAWLGSSTWQSSPSQGRRYSITIALPQSGSCLPSYAHYSVQYVRANGSVIKTDNSQPGECDWWSSPFTSNGEYAYARCRIVSTGAYVERYVNCSSEWN
jgi:hypothetical protein